MMFPSYTSYIYIIHIYIYICMYYDVFVPSTSLATSNVNNEALPV